MKTLVYHIDFLIISMFCISSCMMNNADNMDTNSKIVSTWQSKKVLFPNRELEVRQYNEFIDRNFEDVSICKILLYVDSVGCTACQMQLPKWKELIDSCRIYNLNVSFVFIVYSNDYEKLESMVYEAAFDYPIIYDRKNEFDKLNHFPPAPYRTFLLDKDNKVLLVGSPIGNPKMWALYKKVITQTQTP